MANGTSGTRGSGNSAQDGLETAIEDIAKKDGNINIGSPKIEKVLNAAPIGTKIEYDAFNVNGQTMQMQSEKTGSNTWTQTWRVKNGNIFWTAEENAGYIADDLWNYYNGSYE